MKIITVETKYYLLKPHEIQTETSDYYYVKIVNELMPERAVWMLGYVNHMGGISAVGCPFEDEELVKQLDAELEEALSTDSQTREKCHYYDEAQGRYYCVNPLTSGKCDGVCKHFWTGIISDKID